MWHREFKDYKTDRPLIQYQVEPGRGIIGCEMHDLNGWGTLIHIPRKRKRRGVIGKFIAYLLGEK
jgi:hypothetical protein